MNGLANPYSTAHVDYFQRTGIDPGPALASDLKAPLVIRRLCRIKGIGVADKQRAVQGWGMDQRVQLATEDVIVGLHGHKVPLCYLLRGHAGSVAVYLGVWSTAASGDSRLDSARGILKTSLSSLFSSIQFEDTDPEVPLPPVGGLALGLPTLKQPDPLDGALPVDRLIRALAGAEWACLVLAQPVQEEAIGRIRDSILNEMRVVQSAVRSEGAPSPLADYYMELLQGSMKSLSLAKAGGGWRTAVYLLGDSDSYRQLASVWRGIYAGDDSLPQPIRVWDSGAVTKFAAQWTMSDRPCTPGPGLYNHPLLAQTVLSSAQLSAYVHLPQIETIGFAINTVPSFHVVPQDQPAEARPQELGNIVQRGVVGSSSYEFGLDTLKRHAFVAGVTGAGKTTTIFQILKKAAEAGVPFLVIEPAKTEYRELLNHSGALKQLQVFTLGNEQVSPLRLNPLEVDPGTPVAVHIDLLRSVFSVSFGLWTPLPQILERSLNQVYADKGWDVTSNHNRLTDHRREPQSFPTLSELLEKIDEVTSQLSWDPEAIARIRGSLLDRLRSLTAGGKGRMLDTRRSLPMETLLEHSGVLELESLGDDDDKAFVMGLILIRLVEYRRGTKAAQGKGSDNHLKHLLVFEEAHRLLANVGSKGDQNESNPRAKAVESFGNLLSEVRAYGQGIIIADQVPVKLAPDVIKNTNLKISHQIVDAEDRRILAGSMHMTEPQTEALATLPLGRAAVFCTGDDGPLLVQVKGPDGKHNTPTDIEVKQRMTESESLAPHLGLLLPHPACTDVGLHGGRTCDVARQIVGTVVFRRDFARIVLSLVEDAGALSRVWTTLDRHMMPMFESGIDPTILAQCVIWWATDWFASHRGSQSGWSYKDRAQVQDHLCRLLAVRENEQDSAKALQDFKNCLVRLHMQQFPPFARCEEICDQPPHLCLYRHAVREIIDRGSFGASWSATDPLNAEPKNASWAVCEQVAQQLVETTPEQTAAIRRIGLCFGQQMLLQSAGVMTPELGDGIFDSLREAQRSSGEASGRS